MGVKKSKACLATLVLGGGLIGGLIGSGVAQANGCDGTQGSVVIMVSAAEPVDSSRFRSIIGRRRLWKEWRVN